jgi:CheY-like chemotaxis protein
LKADPETRSIPVILCAGEENRQRAADSGASYYVQKPVAAGPLLFGVRQVLGSL